MSKYTVKFNPRLAGQLENHAAFLARVSKPAARRLLSEFRALIKQLSDNPYLYPPYEDPNLPPDIYRKAVLGKWYNVVYSVEGNCVYVDAVMDGRMQE